MTSYHYIYLYKKYPSGIYPYQLNKENIIYYMAQQTIQYNVKVNTDNSVKTLGQLEEELAQINEELQNVDRNSQAFEDLAKRSQDTTKELEKVNNQIEGIRGEDKIQALDGSLKVLGGTVQGVVGGLGLLGVESEQFGKFEEKAASAIALGIGIKDVGEGVGQLAQFTKKLPGPTKAAAAAQKAFNIVLRANPIGLIVTAIGLVVAGFLLFSDKARDLIKSIEPLNKVLQKTVNFFKMIGRSLGLVATEEEEAAEKFKKATDSRIADIDRELALRKARGEETVELEREKLQKLIALTEEGTEEQKNAVNDLAVFEAGLLKKKQDDIDAANQIAADKRKEEREKKEQERIAEEEKEKQRLDKVAEDLKKRKDDAKALAEEEKLEAELLGLSEFDAEREKLDREYEEKLAKLDEFNISKEDLDKNYLAKKKEILDAENQAVKDTADANVAIAEAEADMKDQVLNSTIDNFQGALAALFGESKAVASANVLVDAAQAGVGIIKTAQKGGNIVSAPLYIASQFALLGATTIASLKQINSTTPGSRGGSFNPVAPGGGGFSSQAPTTQTATSATQQQLDVTEASSRGQQPVRAYVIAGEVTSAQEANARLNQRRVVGRN